MNKGHHEAAIPQLQAVLAKHPDAAYYAQSLLGVAYLKTKRYEPAVDSLEKAVEIVPHDAVNHYNLGLCLLSEGNLERGQAEIRRAMELDPNIPSGKALLESLAQVKRSDR